MAIRATDVTLRDLSENTDPGFVRGQDGYGVGLLSRLSMVKFEHNDVALPAVNTRMCAEISAQVAAVLFAIPLDPRNFLPDVGCAVPDVVTAPVPRVTRTAPALSRPLRLLRERELSDRLDETAVVAASSLREFGKCERQRRTSRDSGRSFLRRAASRTCILSPATSSIKALAADWRRKNG